MFDEKPPAKMDNIWLESALGAIKVLILVYDIITYPVYLFVYRPWEKKALSRRVKAKAVSVEEKSITYRNISGPKKMHQILVREGVDTMEKMFRFVSVRYNNKNCLGTRKIIAEEDEIQPNGRIFKKYVMGNYNWLTYQDVEKMSKLFGRGLCTLGQQPRKPVVIFAETRAEWMIAAHGCFKQNIPIVTIYATLGEDAIAHGINETEVSIVVTSHDLLPKFHKILPKTPGVKTVIYMEDQIARTNTSGFQNVKILSFTEVVNKGCEHKGSGEVPSPSDIAIIMYTSGSTGVPKGVLLSHANMLSTLKAFSDAVEIFSEDIFMGYLPLAHVFELLAESVCLLCGVSIGYSTPLTMIDTSSKIKRGTKGDASVLHPTCLTAVPLILDRIYKGINEKVSNSGPFRKAVFQFAFDYKKKWMRRGFDTPLLNRLVFGQTRQLMGGRVRLILSGGAPLSPDTHELVKICLCVQVLQGYGLTESCSSATVMDVHDKTTGRVGAPTIGCDIRLVDWEEGNYRVRDKPYPRGEIIIGGNNVSTGYYKLPEKTKEDFFEEDGRQWFKTGDIGEVYPDGSIKIIDRKKDLVKLQAGEYVSLGKVESELKTCPVVENICIYGDSSKHFTVALVVPNPQQLKLLAGDQETPFEELCKDPKVEQAVLQELEQHAKKCKLEKFEVPAAVKLCSEVWSPDMGLVTAAFKLKRKDIQERYQHEINRIAKWQTIRYDALLERDQPMSLSEEDNKNTDDLEFITFSLEVQSAIDQVLPSKDPLDQPNFNAVDYINSIFPTEQSLSNIDDVIMNLENKIQSIDDEMRTVIRGQTTLSKDGYASLQQARLVINQLLIHAEKIKNQAQESENTVREITRDIKQLDAAKKNLTVAITTLNHLHMLVSGVETLKSLTKNRLYGEIILPLQGVSEVMEHFNNYMDIPQVSQLSQEVQDIRVALAQQITDDFNVAFSETNVKQSVPLVKLTEACKVVSVLDPEVKSRLLKWFINLQLAEYVHLFQESQDCAWLDKIDKRYAWIKHHLLSFEEKFGSMFPPDWEVSERITVEFCKITRNDLSKLINKHIAEVDVKLLLYAIQRTDNFENLLARRFSGITLLLENSKFVKNTNPFEKPNGKNGNEQSVHHPFHGIIGQCFEPHLNIYVQSLDRNLLELMERFLTDTAKHFSTKELGDTEATVLPSCADLFVFYKKCLVQCSQLSTSVTMLQLSHTFQKYLREYAIKILQNNLPKMSNLGGSLTGGKSALTRSDIAAGFIQSLLKEGEVSRLEKEEQRRICTILTTAEYCLETVQQLEDKLKEKIDKELAEQINMAQELDIFHSVISNSIQLLVQDLETACDASLVAMTKMNWQSVESVGDQSPYVTAINNHLKLTIPFIRDQLVSSRKYFTQFCVKFASVFIPKFISSLYKCRSIGTVGAEQLLLDTHSLKTVLLEMPSIGSQIQRKAPPSYTKNVMKGMGKAEMILKVVMSPVEPEGAFVDQVARLLPETDQAEFQKLLEMKGIKRNEQHVLLELRKERGPSIKTNTLSSPDHEASRIRKLEKLINRK